MPVFSIFSRVGNIWACVTRGGWVRIHWVEMIIFKGKIERGFFLFIMAVLRPARAGLPNENDQSCLFKLGPFKLVCPSPHKRNRRNLKCPKNNSCATRRNLLRCSKNRNYGIFQCHRIEIRGKSGELNFFLNYSFKFKQYTVTVSLFAS